MRIALAMVAVAGMAAACGGNDSTGMSDAGSMSTDGISASGTVIGAMAAAGPVVVLWLVNSMPSAYSYKFGDGTATAATFAVSQLRDPPAGARNQTSSVDLGVGSMVLLRPGATIPDGALISQPNAIGYSLQYALIYRGAADTGTDPAWTSGFPVGLSCGRCVLATSGLDTFRPVDCATLVIDTNPNAPGCNWH
jgi:hypothetical protein